LKSRERRRLGWRAADLAGVCRRLAVRGKRERPTGAPSLSFCATIQRRSNLPLLIHGRRGIRARLAGWGCGALPVRVVVHQFDA